MPLYVYSCDECEIELEELRSAFQADDPVECPICHGLCVRAVSNFSTRSRSAEATIVPPAGSRRAMAHPPSCRCCR
jgi:putative FmdB family regulatory protein